MLWTEQLHVDTKTLILLKVLERLSKRDLENGAVVKRWWLRKNCMETRDRKLWFSFLKIGNGLNVT